jgi:hypothetical protein
MSNMYKYKLVAEHDSKKPTIDLVAPTFVRSLEEALGHLNWYLIEINKHKYKAVECVNPAHVIMLKEKEYEDAQYELIKYLGYKIVSAKPSIKCF